MGRADMNARMAQPGASKLLEEVAEGLFRLNLPVPFKGLRQVNLWFLRDGPDWLMIDCGWGDAETRETISQAWSELPGGGRVTRLLVTHFHPDHVGNSRWIAEEWGIPPIMSPREWEAAKRSDALLGPDNVPEQSAYFLRNGLSDTLVQRYRDEFLTFDQGVALPHAVETVQDGDVLEIGGADWRVLTGGGHSPEMVMLYAPERRLFISGDQLLPRISSNVSIGYWNAEADTLSDFLASMARLQEMLVPEDLVLPSHGEPFTGGAERAAALLVHHEERLAEMRTALVRTGEMTVADFLPVLFSTTLDGTQIGFAMGEVAAHLNHLIQRNEARATRSPEGRVAFLPA